MVDGISGVQTGPGATLLARMPFSASSWASEAVKFAMPALVIAYGARFGLGWSELTDEEWDYTLAVNMSAFFHLTKAALPHMEEGGAIIGSSSVNSDMPSPDLAPYAMTKAGIANFTASLAQMLAEKGIRANSVAPGPVWTPLIPATMPPEKVEGFGEQVPMGRAGQPAELAPVYVLLASDEASYISGARIAVTGGKPIL